MRPDDPAEVPLEPVAPRPAVVEQPDESLPRRRSHLVVVVTRALDASEAGDSGDGAQSPVLEPARAPLE